MIEAGLFTLWRKIRFYRAVILFCTVISAFTIFSGCVVAFLLFDGAFQLSDLVTSTGALSDLTPEKWSLIATAAQRESELAKALVFTAGATFLFGFVLPALMIRKLVQSLRKLEQQLRQTLHELVVHFTKTLEQYGEDPFANAQYWAELAMIAVQFAGKDSRNPSLALMGDLAGLTRQEMAKIRDSKPSKKPA